MTHLLNVRSLGSNDFEDSNSIFNLFNPTSSHSRANIIWKISLFEIGAQLRLTKFFTVKSDNKERPEEFTFHLYMNPNHKYAKSPSSSSSSSSYVVFNINAAKDLNKCITVRCRFSVIDTSGKRCLTQDSITKFQGHSTDSSGSSTNGFYSLSREHILDPKSGLLKDDTLTIFCELQVMNDNSTESYKHQQLTGISKVLQDYDSLLENAKFMDVVLVVGNTRAKKVFRAHKAILTVRSPVFGAKFAHTNTKEAQESKVVITDVEPDVFEQFIRYIYTGKVSEMDKYAQELLTIADKYQMGCLKTLCSHYLSTQLTIELVSSIFVLADLHSAAELKSNCVDYIVEHAEEVMASEEFAKHIKNKPELMFELFQKQSIKRFKK